MFGGNHIELQILKHFKDTSNCTNYFYCNNGYKFLDDKLWNVIIAVIGVIAYGIVGLLYSVHLINEKKEGKTAYVAVFIILIIIGFLIYQGILKVEQWIFSWPLAVKITVPIVMGILIVGTIVLLLIEKKRPHK